MTDKMKKLLKNTGWLVVAAARRTMTATMMAAALVLGITACSSEDNLAEEPTLQPAGKAVSSIGVTVGAGFADDEQTRGLSGDGEATTRSAVVTEDGKRKLTFTTGDRLFVRSVIKNTNPEKIVAGYLTIVGTPAEGATEATFSGTLDVYEQNASWEYEPSTYEFQNADDPLAECGGGYEPTAAWLVHKDAGTAFVVSSKYCGSYVSQVAATVDELMKSCLTVSGSYNTGTKTFALGVYDPNNSGDYEYPILNVSVTGGLTAGATYAVVYDNGAYFHKTLGNITADTDGKASFACYFRTDADSHAYSLRLYNLSSPYDWRKVNLGTKALTSKVYNVSRAASDVASGITFPTITGTTFSSYDVENTNYVIDGGGAALNFKLSGTAEGMFISVQNYTTATVTLSNGFSATAGNTFLYFSEKGKDVSVVLDGNSSIECNVYNDCLYSCGPIRLSGSGALTIKTKNNAFCGINSKDNYVSTNNDRDNTSEVDVTSQLAAPGYSVTRSERTENADLYSWTYTVAPVPYKDPEGRVIEDYGVNGWLRDNGFTQADINALGSNAAATDKLYLCWMYNCDFTVEGAGFVSLTIPETTTDEGYIKTATVQLTRKAPLGRINGVLYFYANGSTQPIPYESVEFFGDNNDDTFATARSTDEVTQTATATFNNSVRATSVTAEITVPFVDNGEEF